VIGNFAAGLQSIFGGNITVYTRGWPGLPGPRPTS
jgi:hypothetical protein